MPQINYPPTVDPATLVGRVMGPDMFGAWYVVVDAERQALFLRIDDGDREWGRVSGSAGQAWPDDPDYRTRARLRPLSRRETAFRLDEHGQRWDAS